MALLENFAGFLWGWFLIIILLGTGVFLTIRLKGIQFRYFGRIFKNIKKSMKKTDGVSGFGALCAALGSQVGTGNLVGVASALVSGGPGAIFWMWITALVGMCTNFCEVVLGQVYRDKDKDGTFAGGPSYYISKGLKCKPLAAAYTLFVVLGIGVVYVMLQSNSVVSAVRGMTDAIPAVVVGLFLMVLTALVIFGGMKRLADFASFVVPFMSIAYLLVAMVILAINIKSMPAVVALIFKSAFSFKAVGGGIIGHTIKNAIRYGVARGLFSNDAGNGTAAALHSTANVKHPFAQGLSGMLGVFVDTVIVCSSTAFIILSTGALDSGKEGIELTQYALSSVMGKSGGMLILVAMFLFGFTSLLADIQIGEINLGWICARNKKVITAYRVLACVLVIVSAVIPTATLWTLVDILTAFMVLVNVIPLIALSGKVKDVANDYEKQIFDGVEEPVWDMEKM
ncbi:alanine/glycine:cation symporter family protein [Anaerotignum sp.]|uniref:alanine/glycine:cation symporter family protein n=1 Tax=Anaerotignum sp. TaxID=2039241 RepID=UPI0027146D36|nr:sodium:alanine symporter family protein [Anaerotignum sp.]